MKLITQEQMDKVNKIGRLLGKMRGKRSVCLYYANNYTPDVLYGDDYISWTIELEWNCVPFVYLRKLDGKKELISITNIFFDYVSVLKKLRKDLNAEIRQY